MKTKRIVSWILFAATLGLTDQAHASTRSPDVVPAATLLLPHFEIDFSDPSGNGIDTFVTIVNTSATAVLAHITLWTDLGIPTLRHNIYLTGYDQENVNLRSLFTTGRFDLTASAGQDPGDRNSPKGLISQDINFASCSGALPQAPLPAGDILALQRLHTGQPVPEYTGRCTSVNHNDNIARGYMTIDTVNNCTYRVPNDIGYIGPGGTGDMTNQNVLVGSYTVISRRQGYAFRDSMVHIEAQFFDFIPGDYTFYGRYVAGTAIDNREPLGSVWASRFGSGGSAGSDTDLYIWRDTASAVNTPFICNNLPSPFPLPEGHQVYAFDDQENPVVLTADFAPYAANRVTVGSTDMPVPFSSGWLYLNMNGMVSGSPFLNARLQSHITTGRRVSGQSAIELFNAGNPNPIVDLAEIGTR